MLKKTIACWLFLGAFMLTTVSAQETTTNYKIENRETRLFIGLELRTNNREGPAAIPAHWQRIYSENVLAQIPNKINENVLALYTDYASDHTDDYSCIIGCEVSSLENIPAGLVGKTMSASKYAVYSSKGSFPEGLVAVWQTIWKSQMPRSYGIDFELYTSQFHPVENPEVQVYLSIQGEP